MRYVALLRGINVGGNRKVPMRELKAVFEDAGMSEVTTYINSGNVIFESEGIESRELGSLLEEAIESHFGFHVRVMLRSATEIRALFEALPDEWTNGLDSKCDVMFLAEEIDSADILGQLTIKPEIDDVLYVPGAILWRVDRDKVTRSGMLKLVGTKLYASMTVRNCNTARKLFELMQ